MNIKIRNKYKYRFSLFTATYNRASFLPSLYECIKKQDFDRDLFEWVVVSDGSTDNTATLIKSYQDECVINIKFVDKENGGKHTAWRAATTIFEGQYIICADDDDPISPQMLSTFNKYWNDLENDSEYDSFWEVKARCKYENGKLVGYQLPEPYFDSSYIDIEYKLKKGSEMLGCRKVEVIRNEASVPDYFPFMEMCSNYPEGLRWIKASRKYKTRFVKDVLRTYVIGHDSLCVTPKGSVKSEKKCYNSLSGAIINLNDNRDLLIHYSFKNYLLTCLQISYNSIKVRRRIGSYINNKVDQLLVLLLYVPAFFIFLFRK